MVLLEQLGELWSAKGLENSFIERKGFSRDEEQDFKARLAVKLYELRKQGKPVTPISDRQFDETCYGTNEGGCRHERTNGHL
jgi:hypothetical protein